MNLDTIPLFSMLRGKLGYLNQRQQLIANNVANSDTPGFTPADLKAFTFQGQVEASQNNATAMRATSAGHMSAPGTSRQITSWTPETAPDSETTLNGNRVVLEEQMIKMTEARMDYDAAISFYQKSMNLIRMAARRPGG
jgi:flagellar basal-body rod protein FlgB